MAYAIEKTDTSVQAALRRIARQQVRKAIAEIDDPELSEFETVHQVRKRCKKLRGLLRGVRSSFDDYSSENKRFRDIARALSGARDDDVLIETFDALIADAADGAVLTHPEIRERLCARRDARREARSRAGPAMAEKLAAARGELDRSLLAIARWKLSEDGFPALKGGMKKTYGRSCDAYRAARKVPTAENLHEWRKRVKYHGYHTRFLLPVWPVMMTARRDETSRLGDLLGDHRDLAVLMAVLRDEPSLAGGAEVADDLWALAGKRQEALLADALALGARMHAERPKRLVKRWRKLWKAWRKDGWDGAGAG